MIWNVTSSLSAALVYEGLDTATPRRLEWANYGDMKKATERAIAAYSDHEFWEIPSMAFSGTGTPVLRVTDRDFSIDYFQVQSYHFVSARLRKAFGVDDRVVRFREIDTSPSVPEVQARGYCAFDVLQFGNPFDPTRMLGEERGVRQPDGSLRREWILDWVNRVQKSPEIYFRDDFIPPAPIFRATGSFWIFATDEFADRVMRAGITDMAFEDITGPIDPLSERKRQLR